MSQHRASGAQPPDPRPEHRPADQPPPEPDDAPTDAVLATQAALGDRAAFTVIVHRHGPRMYRYALRMLDGDHHGAEDAVQEALADAWVSLPRFRGESALSTWLFRLAANRVLAARRRRRPVPVDDRLLEAPDAAEHGPQDTMQSALLWQTLDTALAELPWRQRASWLLFEIERLSYEEIAAVLDTSTTVVRGQLHRARGTLAVRMAQWR